MEINVNGVTFTVTENKVNVRGKTREQIVKAVEYAIAEGIIDNSFYVFFDIEGEDGEDGEEACSY